MDTRDFVWRGWPFGTHVRGLLYERSSEVLSPAVNTLHANRDSVHIPHSLDCVLRIQKTVRNRPPGTHSLDCSCELSLEPFNVAT